MKRIIKKANGIELIIVIDKESPDNLYLDEAGNPKRIDQDFILHETYLAKTAKRKKKSVTIKLTAISKKQHARRIESMNSWVERQPGVDTASNLSVILSNKGY